MSCITQDDFTNVHDCHLQQWKRLNVFYTLYKYCMTQATCTNVFEYLTTIGTMNKNGTKRLPTKYSLRICHLLIMQNFRANEQPILREWIWSRKEKERKFPK